MLHAILDKLLPRPPDLHSLEEWRKYVLSVVFAVCVTLGAIVGLPSIVLAFSNGFLGLVATDVITLALTVTLWRSRSITFRIRAWGLCALWYFLSIAMLFNVGPASQFYLMVSPVLAAIFLGLWPAVSFNVLCAITILSAGYFGDVNIQVAGFETQPLLKWIVIAINFAFVSTLITLSVALLIRGLGASLGRIRDSEERFRTVFRTSPDAIILNRLNDGVYLEVNEGFSRFAGFDHDEVVGKDSTTIQIWRDLESRQRLHEAVRFHGFVENMEADFVTKTGRIITALISSHAISVDGENCLLSVVRDITDRKRAEGEMLSAKDKLQAIVAGIPVPLFVKDSQSRILLMNQACEDQWGISSSAMVGTDGGQLFPPEQMAFYLTADQRVFADGRSINFIEPIWSAIHQANRVGHTFKNPVYDAAGQPLYLVCTTIDITEQEEARAALRLADRSIVEAQRIAHAGSYLTDIASGTWTSTDALDEILGIDPGFVKTSASWATLIAPGYEQKVASYYLEAVTHTDTRVDIEYQIVRPSDGEVRWIHVLGEFAYDATGKACTLGGLIQDITERKGVELELQDHRDHLEEMVQKRTSELKKAYLSIATQKNFIRTVADAVPIMIAYWTADLRCGFANHAYGARYGVDADQLIGMRLRDVLDATFFQQCEQHIDAVLRGDPQHFHPHWVTLDGASRYLSVQYLPHRVQDTVVGFYVLTEDITDLRAAEQLLQGTNRQLAVQVEVAEVATLAKSRFLANMSHEIRTPMNGIVGMIDVLQASQLSREQHRILRTIHESSLSLLSILNDILDLSKIEAGKMNLELIPTPLREVVEGVAQLMLTSVQEKGLLLSVFVSPDLPQWILSDPTRLRQVLLNLLGNAIKFTSTNDHRAGEISLFVEPLDLPNQPVGIQICVRDNGIGMAPDSLDKLFEPFTQANASTARTHGGTGLGLSIARRLIELLGGQIAVSSTLGEGSTFTVQLPLQASEAGRVEKSEKRLDGVHVIAMTRNATLATILEKYCAAAGATVNTAEDLITLGAQIARSPVTSDRTVVALGTCEWAEQGDLNLPPGVGFVRVAPLTQGDNGKEVFVASNPMLYEELLHGVRRALGGGTILTADTRRDARSNLHFAVHHGQAQQHTDQRILLAEDNETNREVIRQQLGLLGYAVDEAQDGAIALTLWSSGAYTLLLTDCQMPNLDGFGLAEAIRRAEPIGTHMPIIAVTANAMQGEEQRCKDHGMDDYLTKPVRLHVLAAMLEKWIPVDSHGRSHAESLSAEPPNLAIWDAGTLTQMVGDDLATHRRLLEKFLTTTRSQMADIATAAAAHDAPSIGAHAHKVKSAARAVGALALGDICERMEAQGNAKNLPACTALAESSADMFARVEQQIRAHLAQEITHAAR